MQFECVVNSLVYRPVESSPRFDVLYLLRFVKQGNGSVPAHCFTNLNIFLSRGRLLWFHAKAFHWHGTVRIPGEALINGNVIMSDKDTNKYLHYCISKMVRQKYVATIIKNIVCWLFVKNLLQLRRNSTPALQRALCPHLFFSMTSVKNAVRDLSNLILHR